MAVDSVSEELLNEMGEDYVDRLRRGESPSVSEYVSRFSGRQAAEVAEFLDSIVLLESMKGDSSPPEMNLDGIPEQFGRYRIERSLGEGGMGAVYLAHDSQLDRKVALKTPKFTSKSSANLVSRFYREARSAATLQHPNICPVYDVGKIDGIHYISMAYIDGRPLSDYIKSKKPAPVTSVLQIVRKVALALYEAHEQGLIHRDLKPANIMISRRNEPIVMDFGLARQFGSGEADPSSESTNSAATNTSSAAGGASSVSSRVEARLTMDGTIVGSPAYMSPEQLRGEHAVIGPASDVYALGVLLYELLTSKLPFPGDGTLMSVIKAVMTDEPPDASAVREQLDFRVVAICKKAMARKPADRYESMQAFAVALTTVLKSDFESSGGDNAMTSKVSEIPNPEASPELVRTKEQYELARSLYQENQYAAAVSILEKMVVGGEKESNRFTAWAQKELPRAREKATEKAARSSREDQSSNSLNGGFWAEDLDAAAEVPTDRHLRDSTRTSGRTSTRKSKSGSKSRPKKKSKILSGLIYAAVSVLVLIGVFAIAARLGKNRTGKQGSQAVTAALPDSASQDPAPVEPASAETESTEPKNGKQKGKKIQPDRSSKSRRNITPVERFWRFDADKDGMLSKSELSTSRAQGAVQVKEVIDNFDEYDLLPRDGLLDANEVRRVFRLLFKGNGRDNRTKTRP